MQKFKLAAPIVKWVGGKRQLLDSLVSLLPQKISYYCEPFLGGGALFFQIQPQKAVVNDINSDLMTVYQVIKDDVDALIESLKTYRNTPEQFYRIRDLDRKKEKYQSLSTVERASRFIYLNKTCYNGLFRVNSAGEFNSPFGRYKNPNIVNEPTLRAVNAFFNTNDIQFSCMDFEEVLKALPKGSFVYLDPPYDPVSSTSNFTGYNKGGFGKDEQLRLKECCDDLTRRKIKFMLSNSPTEFILGLYSGYDITCVEAKRSINCNGAKRGNVKEVIIRNYGTK